MAHRFFQRGDRHTEETRAKMRASALLRIARDGNHRKGVRYPDEIRSGMGRQKGCSNPRKGIPRTPDEKKRISDAVRKVQPRGPDAYNFSHGQSCRNLNDRRRAEYREWRNAVFRRDNYTCQNPECGDAKGGRLRAHHIIPFAKAPELRFEVSNGLTLCHTCHELRHFKPDSIRNTRKLKRGEKLWE